MKRTPELGLFSLLSLGVNGMVGVGIFFVPAKISGLVPGGSGTWVYALTVLAVLPVAACYAVLGARFDRDGGPFVWADAAFGKLTGFSVGWVTYVSAVFSTAAVVSGLGEYLGPYLGFVGERSARLFSVLSVGVLSALAALGLRLSAWVWNGLTLLKLLPLGALLLLGVWASSRGAPQPPMSPSPLEPASASNWLRAVLIALFAIQGFEILPVAASSVKRRARNLPLAMALALGFVGALYMALHQTALNALPDLAQHPASLVSAARQLGGARMDYLVSLGTQVSAVGICFGMFAMTPRYLSALKGRDALGEWVGLHSARNVPLPALLVTACVTLALVLIGKLDSLFVLAAMAVLVQFAVSVLSLAVLSWRRANGLARRHLWLAGLALITLVLVALGAERRELAVLGVCLALGLCLRYVQRRLANPG